MKVGLKLVLLCSVLLGITSTARTQAEDRLAAEKEEVIKLAKKFSERYEQTKSLEPLIGEFFRPNLNRYLHRTWLWHELNLDREPGLIGLPRTYSGRALLRRYYAAFNDYWFVSEIWHFQTGTHTFPEDVNSVLMKEPLTIQFVKDDDLPDDEERLHLANRRNLDKYTTSLERALEAFRKHLKSFPAEKAAKYQAAIADFDANDGHRYFEPELDICEKEEERRPDEHDDCHGLPNKSRIFDVVIPPAHYIFIGKVHGKWRILDIFPHLDN